jgi:hypothetical protein
VQSTHGDFPKTKGGNMNYLYHILERENPVTRNPAYYVVVVDWHGNIQDTGRHFGTEQEAIKYTIDNPFEH